MTTAYCTTCGGVLYGPFRNTNDFMCNGHNDTAMSKTKELLEQLDTLGDWVSSARTAIKYYNKHLEEIKKKDEKITELNKEVRELRAEITLYKHMVWFLTPKGKKVIVCKSCQGEGGGVGQIGENEYEPWECDKCEASGFFLVDEDYQEPEEQTANNTISSVENGLDPSLPF